MFVNIWRKSLKLTISYRIHPPQSLPGVPSSSLWWAPVSNFFAVRQRKLRNGDLLRDRDFTLPEVDGVVGVELEPGAVLRRSSEGFEGAKVRWSAKSGGDLCNMIDT